MRAAKLKSEEFTEKKEEKVEAFGNLKFFQVWEEIRDLLSHEIAKGFQPWI
jgi:hypothetical protein